MQYLDLLSLAEFGQGLTILLSLVGYVPQWIAMYTAKSSENLSTKCWWLWLISNTLAANYAIVAFSAHGSGGVLVATSLINLVFTFITLVAIVYYKRSGDRQQISLDPTIVNEAVISIDKLTVMPLEASTPHETLLQNSEPIA